MEDSEDGQRPRWSGCFWPYSTDMTIEGHPCRCECSMPHELVIFCLKLYFGCAVGNQQSFRGKKTESRGHTKTKIRGFGKFEAQGSLCRRYIKSRKTKNDCTPSPAELRQAVANNRPFASRVMCYVCGQMVTAIKAFNVDTEELFCMAWGRTRHFDESSQGVSETKLEFRKECDVCK